MTEFIITCQSELLKDGSYKIERYRELIRCKDCDYWQDNNDGYPHIGCKWREDESPDPDDFCSAGERKQAWTSARKQD